MGSTLKSVCIHLLTIGFVNGVELQPYNIPGAAYIPNKKPLVPTIQTLEKSAVFYMQPSVELDYSSFNLGNNPQLQPVSLQSSQKEGQKPTLHYHPIATPLNLHPSQLQLNTLAYQPALQYLQLLQTPVQPHYQPDPTNKYKQTYTKIPQINHLQLQRSLEYVQPTKTHQKPSYVPVLKVNRAHQFQHQNNLVAYASPSTKNHEQLLSQPLLQYAPLSNANAHYQQPEVDKQPKALQLIEKYSIPRKYQHTIPTAAIRNVEIIGITKTITPVVTRTITRQTHSEPAVSVGYVHGYSHSAKGDPKVAPVKYETRYNSYANPIVGVNGPVTYSGPAAVAPGQIVNYSHVAAPLNLENYGPESQLLPSVNYVDLQSGQPLNAQQKNLYGY